MPALRILILDDDTDFAVLLATTLQQPGWSCQHVRTLAEADAKLGSTTFDLIIVDGMLPDGNGIDWIERARSAGHRVPIWFISLFYNDPQCRDRLRATPDVRAWDKRHIRPPELLQAAAALVDGD